MVTHGPAGAGCSITDGTDVVNIELEAVDFSAVRKSITEHLPARSSISDRTGEGFESIAIRGKLRYNDAQTPTDIKKLMAKWCIKENLPPIYCYLEDEAGYKWGFTDSADVDRDYLRGYPMRSTITWRGKGYTINVLWEECED